MSDLNQSLATLVDGLNKMSGPAVNAALASAQVDAYSSIVVGAIGAAMAIGGYKGFRWCFKRAHAADDEGIPFLIGCAVAAFAMLIGAIMIMTSWLDPWTWVTLAHPEYWVAHKILLQGAH